MRQFIIVQAVGNRLLGESFLPSDFDILSGNITGVLGVADDLLDHVRPVLATSYAYVNPVVAVALGLTIGAESLTAAGLLALPLILGGVALMSGYRADLKAALQRTLRRQTCAET